MTHGSSDAVVCAEWQASTQSPASQSPCFAWPCLGAAVTAEHLCLFCMTNLFLGSDKTRAGLGLGFGLLDRAVL